MSKDKDDKNISTKDIYLLQTEIRKKINVDKPKSEMSEEELAQIVAYEALDKVLEETLGQDVKSDIDNKRKVMEETDKFKDNLTQVVNFGIEVEKNLTHEAAYYANHFDKSEDNHIYVAIDKLSDTLVNDKTISAQNRIHEAEKLLKIIDEYEKLVTEKVSSHKEMYKALFRSLKEKFEESDFEYWNKSNVAKESINMRDLESNLARWIALTEQLFPYRDKALEAVKYDLRKDRIIPNMIIENDGDLDGTTSTSELAIAVNNLSELIQAVGDFEEKMSIERSDLSKKIFGEIDIDTPEYMKKAIPKTSNDPLLQKKWYRAYKVFNILAHIIGVGIALALLTVSFVAFIITFIFVLLTLWGVKKAVRYIALG